MLKCEDAYDNIVSGPKITFRQGYLTVESICNRFKISPKLFYTIFENFSGDGPFTNKGRPWMIGILFFIAVYENQNWLRVDVLEKMRPGKSFSLTSCSYEEALRLLKVHQELIPLRILDGCHGVNVLKNICDKLLKTKKF